MKKFISNLFVLIIFDIFRTSANNLNILTKNGYFPSGIIWSLLKNLILASGVSFVFSVGLKGSGLSVEYLFFNLLLWFCFVELVNTTISLKFNNFILLQRGVTIYAFYLAHCMRIGVQFFCCLALSFCVFFILEIDIHEISIVIGFTLMFLIGLLYGIVMSALLHDRALLIELHNYAMQGLFFMSATVIPIQIFPEGIRDLILWIPIVHIQEYIKSFVTDVDYSYISLLYPVYFIVVGLFFLLPSLYFKGLKFNEGK